MTAATVTASCTFCGGAGTVEVERVPSGRERAAGVVTGERRHIPCAGCCPSCDEPRGAWPARDCESPEAHRGATYVCACGETVTIDEALDRPTRHRRCNEIGSATAATLAVAFCIALGLLLGGLVALGDRVMCSVYDNTLASCPGYGQPSTGSGP